MSGPVVTLILSGGIAAYKVLIAIRRLREAGVTIQPVMTRAASEFVTPLSVASLAEHKVYQDLWSLTDEAEMGHIRLARSPDLVVVAPASADLMAKMAHGFADDLASTLLLAATGPVLLAPAMNPAMWGNPATQANLRTLTDRGIHVAWPDDGGMACGEEGTGRLVEPPVLVAEILHHLVPKPLAGRRAIVTGGPTAEPLDPVRVLTNHSSGKQAHAIATALARAGADVTYVSGPTALPAPHRCHQVSVQTAEEMLAAVEDALPADIAVCAAAVGDYRPAAPAEQKMKKQGDGGLVLELVQTPDILARLGQAERDRPGLVVGFAAETQDVIAYATAKRRRKGADWIVANRVAAPDAPVFGADLTSVHLIRSDAETDHEDWVHVSKADAADRLISAIVSHFTGSTP